MVKNDNKGGDKMKYKVEILECDKAITIQSKLREWIVLQEGRESFQGGVNDQTGTV